MAATATTPGSTTTPDWLATAAKAEAPMETDKIALRASPPPPARGLAPAKSEIEPSEPKKPQPEAPPRLKLNEAAPPTLAETAKPTGDLDVARYPSRVMLPETIVLIAAGVCWVMGAVPYFPVKLQQLEVYAAIPGALALFQLVRFLFRVFAGGYRLTSRQVLRSTAGLFPDPDPIDLATVASVKVEQSIQDWVFCAGNIRLTFERDTHESIVLGPVGWPRRRAKLIEGAVEAARTGQVVATRVAA